LFGNTAGLKASQTRRLLATYRRRVHQRELCSAELARHLSEVSRETGRQIGVLLNRRGEVENVVVGDARQVALPDIGRARAGQVRLRGLRLVHTHLKDEPLTRDDLTDLMLLRLDAVAAIVARQDGLPGRVYLGTLLPVDGRHDGKDLYHQEEFASIQEADFDLSERLGALEQEMGRAAPLRAVGSEGRAILVGVYTGGRRAQAEQSMLELRELARTASVEVVDEILQGRQQIDPRTLAGEGKLQDILVRSMALSADMVVFDRDLTPSQARHVSELTALKILDRTQLILDIFARRAQSADGKLQVELAQLKYLLPRLVGRDDSLSRLAGGIGGRGPGETKLETDRRRVRDRIAHLEQRIANLSADRQTRRRQRARQGVPVISIVGYTNAGKSTLLNTLTDSSVLAEDKLFATLDPTSRRLKLPRVDAGPSADGDESGARPQPPGEVVLTDTVGFIRDLPKDLVNAFRATLEELEEADLLLHVVDASDPRHGQQAQSVERILGTLDLEGTPRLLVFNKADRAPEIAAQLAHAAGGVAVSALTGDGFPALLSRCEEILWRERKVRERSPPP
jgi:GTP-binding protein HflX